VKVRFTGLADNDISSILLQTYRLFGENQTARYAGIIQAGLDMIATQPDRAAAKLRDDIAEGVRLLHLQFAARRQDGASHILYYRLQDQDSDVSEEELVVFRVLSDRMEPRRRVASALKADDRK
jgi:toxin ParE1/3/4